MIQSNYIQINQPTNTGATPLYMACQNGHLNIVKLLINKKDNFKKLTPYVWKVFNGQEEDGNYLLWSEEEEDWIKNRGWERMERKCDSWISIENGKIIEKVKFEDIGFDGRQ